MRKSEVSLSVILFMSSSILPVAKMWLYVCSAVSFPLCVISCVVVCF